MLSDRYGSPAASMHGLVLVLTFSVVASLVAAAASAFRGGR
jgi:hypothetical protein